MRGGGRVLESYVVVHNITKRHNLGTLARRPTTFGVTELVLVGRRDFNSYGKPSSSSTSAFAPSTTSSTPSPYLRRGIVLYTGWRLRIMRHHFN